MNVVKNLLNKFDTKVSYRMVAVFNAVAVLCSTFVIFFSQDKLMKDINMILLFLNGICFVYMVYKWNKYECRLGDQSNDRM